MVGSAIFSASGAAVLIKGSITCVGFIGIARARDAFGSGDSGKRRIAIAFNMATDI
jgi:hypothetical protein